MLGLNSFPCTFVHAVAHPKSVKSNDRREENELEIGLTAFPPRRTAEQWQTKYKTFKERGRQGSGGAENNGRQSIRHLKREGNKARVEQRTMADKV